MGRLSLPILILVAALTGVLLVATLEEFWDLVAYAGTWALLAVLPGLVLVFAGVLGGRRRI
jgi:hypothetical protein